MSVSLVRTLILYVAVICAMRLMGKRQIGELEPSELVITILISELAAIPMQDLGVPLTAGLIPIGVLVSIEIIISFLCLKSRRLRRVVNGRAAVLIYNGKVDEAKLHDLRITTDEIIEALRQNNIQSVADVKYGVLEPNGQLSYVLKPDAQPVTAGLMGLQPPETGVPFLVVTDGKPVLGNLRRLNLTLDDLEKRIKKAHVSSMKDIFLMTLDDCGNQFIQRKEKP
nr:DUF421 domain-containing protein [uncultured Butyricicoccus sp.]